MFHSDFSCTSNASAKMWDIHTNSTSTTPTLEQHSLGIVFNTTRATFTTTADSHSQGLISDELRKLFEVMNFVILSGIISLVGSVCNTINIVVFIKQGLSDPVNISLLGLSVSDLGALVSLIWMSVCFNPLFANSGIDFDSIRVQYLTAGWPHVCCARITSWVTAFITFERCLCVAMPLKVKTIITPKRTTCAIITIFAIMIISICPVYYAIYLGPVRDMTTNKTFISLVYRPNGIHIENISFAINFVAQLTSFVLVIICTVVLVQSLLRKYKWHKHSVCTNTITNRDKRLIKMIISLSTIFIICFLPSAVNLVIMMLTPGYSIVGKQAVSILFISSRTL